MILVFWLIATLSLMLVNLAYVGLQVRRDHREGRPTRCFVGVFALIGAGSWLLLLPYLGFHALMSV